MIKPLLCLCTLFRFLLPVTFLIICANGSFAQNIDFGKSYINVTKGLNGGTVETGDTLEIRASFVVRSGTFDSCRYTVQFPPEQLLLPVRSVC